MKRLVAITLFLVLLVFVVGIVYELESSRTDKCGGVTCVRPDRQPFSNNPSYRTN
jgi:hypothetical protein